MRNWMIFGIVILGGCAAYPPAVSDIDSDMVEVIIPAQAQPGAQLAAARDEAARACALYNRVALHLSSRRVNCYDNFGFVTCDMAMLFACRLPQDELRGVD